MKNNVADWMTRDPITIGDDASIMDAVHLMRERGVRRLPVMHDGRLTGIVTDRMLKDYSPGKATSLDTWEVHYLLSKTSIREAMNARPHTVTPDTRLTDAAKVIRDHKLYGLCVVNEKGDLVGILTIKDLIEALFYLAEVATKSQG
ncbi:MAG TPA: CBS domain-containing protein [Thermoanaerobaculia bacterium]|nr:CBS domain-containing protein [Thermoanaerobaculia bacterium]